MAAAQDACACAVVAAFGRVRKLSSETFWIGLLPPCALRFHGVRPVGVSQRLQHTPEPVAQVAAMQLVVVLDVLLVVVLLWLLGRGSCEDHKCCWRE